MAWTRKLIIIAILLVFTGSINTICAKWANMLSAVGFDGGKPRNFLHPFVQAWAMFIGEFLCILFFKARLFYVKRKEPGLELEDALVRGNQNFNPFIFLPPAMCDMLGTSLMYVGLTLTYASSMQMLRGAAIVFVAVLSIIFLKRKISLKMWIGIIFIIAGLVVVGLCDWMNAPKVPQPDGTRDYSSIGDLIIVLSQVIVATQMVYEEKFVGDKDIPPLQAVGWEGLFGTAVLGLLLIPFYFIPIPKPYSDIGVIENLPDALIQMKNNPLIIVAIVGTILSIAFFNFAGITVSKEISATTRMVLDSVRTFFIYIFSLAVFGQSYHPLQIVGFTLLIIGMVIYNNLLPSWSSIRALCCCGNRATDEESLVPNEEN